MYVPKLMRYNPFADYCKYLGIKNIEFRTNPDLERNCNTKAKRINGGCETGSPGEDL
jgi:hypothetical protein